MLIMYVTSFRLYLTTFVYTSDMILQNTFLEKSLIDKPAIFSNQSPHREHFRCEPLKNTIQHMKTFLLKFELYIIWNSQHKCCICSVMFSTHHQLCSAQKLAMLTKNLFSCPPPLLCPLWPPCFDNRCWTNEYFKLVVPDSNLFCKYIVFSFILYVP